jgi:hypothetical protein
VQRIPQTTATIFAMLLLALAVGFAQRDKAKQKTLAREPEVHRLPGATRSGRPAVAKTNTSGTLRLKIVDADTKQPVFCRVDVVGADGNHYEPAENPLAPWSLHRLGNRIDKGPFRYYGWFFYCNGTCDVAVPAGTIRVQVWKGFEYEPVVVTPTVTKNETTDVSVQLKRRTDMAARGWYSGDTHIHLDRRNETDNQRALDLAAAEDIRFAHIPCMNDPRTYKPTMDAQIWYQTQGLGKKSERFRGPYGIASGQEYRCGTFGHICFVGGSRMVDADGLQTDPNNWPVFGLVADELHSLGGYAFHAHGGYEKEIYADFAQEATDGVELLQFAVYRGIGLEGWYHILNAGFRFPAVGASDYPYCRAFGDCRTYCRLGDIKPTFDTWNRAAAAGKSFVTTGPLLEVTVEGKHPGETVSRRAGQHELHVTVQLSSPVAPVDEIELIVGGKIRTRRKLIGEDRTGPLTWKTTVSVDDSTWLAVRAFAKSGAGRENVEAHTNPVYVSLDGGKSRSHKNLTWLIAKLDERIAYHAGRKFDEKSKVLSYFHKSREILTRMAEAAK